MEIGIITTYPNAESRKNELVNLKSSSSNYIKKIPKKYLRSYNKKKGYPYDILIGYYIMSKYPNVKINFIDPKNLSLKEIKKNVLVFTLIYDILEAMNLTDRGLLIKKNEPNNLKAAKHLENILKKANNIFPPYKYQKLINSKCDYYKYLKNNNIIISPTICIYTKTKEKFIKDIIKSIKTLNISKIFFTKPDGGQESIGARKWQLSDKNDTEYERGSGEYYFKNIVDLKKKLGKYYNNVGTKFPKIIIQKYQPGFDEWQDEDNKKVTKEDISSEQRTFFVGNEYQYTVTTDYFCFRQPKADKGQSKFIDCEEDLAKKKGFGEENVCYLGNQNIACQGPQITIKNLKRTKALAKKTLNILPKIIIQDQELPRLLTRVDVGIIAKKYNKKQPIFVNEVEFVPSLFHKYVHNKKIYEKIGDQMVKITKIFLQKKNKIKLKKNKLTIKQKKIIENIKNKVYARIYRSPYGVGVVAIRDIPKGINPFSTPNKKCWDYATSIPFSKITKIPKAIKEYLIDFYPIDDNNKMHLNVNGPNMLNISMFMNHSNKPNIEALDTNCMTLFRTLSKIKKGTQLTINYNDYPEFSKEDLLFIQKNYK